MTAASAEFLPPPACEAPYSISQINSIIADKLEAGNNVVWVEGEISGFKQASSGHAYFKLKDASSQIGAVIWRSNLEKMSTPLEDGMNVMAIAMVRVYQKGGYYQLDVVRVQPSGIGALHIAFEKLKAKLEAEGLFDPSRKKALPESVARLGVITSKTGAAIQDIIRVVANRSPRTDIVFIDVLVQGAEAPPQIAAAIDRMNRHAAVDVIIVGRGGGSAEDLAAFNDERVARAIAASKIPVISAVGHEIDFTIADFVADLRAPTPSAAAEMAVADTREEARYFKNLAQRFDLDFAGFLRKNFDKKRNLNARLLRESPVQKVRDSRQYFDGLRMRLSRAVRVVSDTAHLRAAGLTGRLEAVSPLGVLRRGYSMVTDGTGKTVDDSGMLKKDEHVRIRFNRGEAAARVTDIFLKD